MAREPIYTAHAHVTGGRADGHGKTDDGVLEVDLRRPKEMGGEGDGTNPEQLFAIGYAACFEGALGAVARREKLEVGDVAIDSSVSLIPTEERGFKLGRRARRDAALGARRGAGHRPRAGGPQASARTPTRRAATST